MATVKTIKIDEQEVTFKSSGALPRMYRKKFGRDLYADFDAVTKTVKAKKGAKTGSSLNAETLETFEDIAWLMAYHADPEYVPDDADIWLEQFNIFSIHIILPELVDLMHIPKEQQ